MPKRKMRMRADEEVAVFEDLQVDEWRPCLSTSGRQNQTKLTTRTKTAQRIQTAPNQSSS